MNRNELIQELINCLDKDEDVLLIQLLYSKIDDYDLTTSNVVTSKEIADAKNGMSTTFRNNMYNVFLDMYSDEEVQCKAMEYVYSKIFYYYDETDTRQEVYDFADVFKTKALLNKIRRNITKIKYEHETGKSYNDTFFTTRKSNKKII